MNPAKKMVLNRPLHGSSAIAKRPKKRGSYNCGRCGLPKRGHSCNVSSSVLTVVANNPTPPRSVQHPRRSLSFDDAMSSAEDGDDLEVADPSVCVVEVLRRLPPVALLSAAMVCKEWRDCARLVWRAAEELRLRVPPRSQVGFVGSVLRRCPGLLRLSLTIESDLDATMLACVAFSCPNLEALEICTSNNAVNRITGDDLCRFVAEKRSLSCLKIEGCTNLGSLNIYSSSLSILLLSDLNSISKMAFNCPNLKELSLDFCRQENDSTDLISMVNSLGKSCLRLRNVHIGSIRLSHAVVLALTNANLRALRILSLVFGSEITDASVAAITSSYKNLESLDLTGSSISDSGIGMICNVLPQTLSRLLLASCPNVTSSGIQFAAAQLPHLQIFDCGMTICDPSIENPLTAGNSLLSDNSSEAPMDQQNVGNIKLNHIYQKLIIKHGRLKKLSLWACSGLDALYLNCPELNELNLNSCTNLHPERLLLQCPSLESVHACGCHDKLIGAIQNEVYDCPEEYHSKRLADGSKRVHAPRFIAQPSDDKERALQRAKCLVRVE